MSLESLVESLSNRLATHPKEDWDTLQPSIQSSLHFLLIEILNCPDFPFKNRIKWYRKRKSLTDADIEILKTFRLLILQLVQKKQEEDLLLNPAKRSRIDTRHKLLILDLNGVLLYRNKRSCLVRPHAVQFLQLMQQHYTLAIWSSCQLATAKKLVQKITGNYSFEFLFIWGQSKCTVEGRKYLKDLSMVWREYCSYDCSNTVLLDDTADKCKLNPPFTCVLPRSFHYSVGDKELHEESALVAYLIALSDPSVRVQGYIEEHPYHAHGDEEDDALEDESSSEGVSSSLSSAKIRTRKRNE